MRLLFHTLAHTVLSVSFSFADDFDKGKPRPSLVISPSFGKHNQVVLAYITIDKQEILDTDILLDSSKPYFSNTGLKNGSVIKLHRLITTEPSQIREVIGQLPDALIPELKKKLLNIFQLR